HVLTLVEGERVRVVDKNDEKKFFDFNYSETIIVPACLGRYEIVNLGKSQCMIAKARLRKN
ncbi:MAG: hypothetical protein GXO74_11985, partial [Calditrichaeota bacterium]|nr:hypothetical protein [Calditrichota bacterium]